MMKVNKEEIKKQYRKVYIKYLGEKPSEYENFLAMLDETYPYWDEAPKNGERAPRIKGYVRPNPKRRKYCVRGQKQHLKRQREANRVGRRNPVQNQADFGVGNLSNWPEPNSTRNRGKRHYQRAVQPYL